MRDRIAAAALWTAALAVAALFASILADLLSGLPALSWSFLVEPPAEAGLSGGIGPILVSTALILAVCLGAAVPVGLGTAVFLAEYADGRFARLVRRSLDVLAGAPSIVFGLFGAAFFGRVLGLGFSILSGGLTLACMVLPLLIRTAEEGLRAVPEDTRRAAAALGLTRASTIARVLLPAARPALAAGLVLSLARAASETAALLFTSGYVDRMPGSLLDSGRALTVHVYDLAMNVPGGDRRAAASALVLAAALLAVNLATSALLRRRPA